MRECHVRHDPREGDDVLVLARSQRADEVGHRRGNKRVNPMRAEDPLHDDDPNNAAEQVLDCFIGYGKQDRRQRVNQEQCGGILESVGQPILIKASQTAISPSQEPSACLECWR